MKYLKDALSRKALTKAEVLLHDCKLSEKARDINLEASENDDGVWLHKLEVLCELWSRIVQAYESDVELKKRINYPELSMASDVVILFEGRICVLNDPEFSRLILEKDYKRSFPIHPGATKMYHDLRKDYWWPGIKTGLAEL